METKLDPWDIAGVADYDKLFKEFGIQPMGQFKEKFRENRYIRRGIIFGHRDFGKVSEAIEKKKPFIMMTGLMPSGRFHFGHKMIADEIIWFQRNGARTFVCAADIESYLMRGVSFEEARKTAIEEYLTNYFALGLTEKNLTFWFQSDYDVPYYRFRDTLANKATLNELNAIYGDLSPEKIISVLTQVADILHPQLPEFGNPMPTVVPVGADQDPHIRLTRDIAYKLRLVQPGATFHQFMEGLQGGKMSSSDPKSYIALTEDPEIAKKKIMGAATGGRETANEQRKLGGQPENCQIYKFYLYHLIDEDKELAERHRLCTSGEILCGECKKFCSEKLERFLVEHQKKREKAKRDVERFLER